MSGKKLVNNEWWEIIPKTDGLFNVVNTHIGSDVIGGGATNAEIVGSFDNEKEAVIFLETGIAFIKDITLPDKDGFELLYEKENHEITVSISRDALAVLDISANTVSSLLEQISFQPLIETLYDRLKTTNNYKIDIYSDMVKIDGKDVCLIDECKDICKIIDNT